MDRGFIIALWFMDSVLQASQSDVNCSIYCVTELWLRCHGNRSSLCWIWMLFNPSKALFYVEQNRHDHICTLKSDIQFPSNFCHNNFRPSFPACLSLHGVFITCVTHHEHSVCLVLCQYPLLYCRCLDVLEVVAVVALAILNLANNQASSNKLVRV